MAHCHPVVWRDRQPRVTAKIWRRNHSSHKLTGCCCLVAQLCPILCSPMDYSLSMGFPRQEYWSGLPFTSQRDLPDPGIEPRSPALQADALPSEPTGKPFKPKVDSFDFKSYLISTSTSLCIHFCIFQRAKRTH